MSTGLPPTLVVTGPTAGGKSRLAVRIARRLSVPIISLDSMKVYRGMDIGTAKPGAELVREIPFHLMDIRAAWESFSVGDYLREVEALVAELPRPHLFCGGTAFYLHALVAGIFAGPSAQPELRASLEEEARLRGTEALHRRLVAADPRAAEKIHPGDLKRIVRALEVIEVCGEPFSRLQAERRPLLAPGSFRLIGMSRPREEVYGRVDARVARMFEEGWVEEVVRLRDAHDPPWSKEAAQSIGYVRIAEALEAGRDPRLALPEIQKRTRHFAKAQLTWFRKMPIEWWEDEEELMSSL